MRAVLIANREDADPGFVGRALRQRGYSFTEFLREDHQNWPSLDGCDLVVAMGSNWSTYWDHVAEPVRAEQTLLADAVSRGIAILGICFGAQQLAVTLGGEITRAKTPEIGWYQVFPVSEATNSSHLCSASTTRELVSCINWSGVIPMAANSSPPWPVIHNRTIDSDASGWN